MSRNNDKKPKNTDGNAERKGVSKLGTALISATVTALGILGYDYIQRNKDPIHEKIKELKRKIGRKLLGEDDPKETKQVTNETNQIPVTPNPEPQKQPISIVINNQNNGGNNENANDNVEQEENAILINDDD